MPVKKVEGQLGEGERDMVRCWVEKSTRVRRLEEALVKHQMEGISEGRAELEKKEEKPSLSSF